MPGTTTRVLVRLLDEPQLVEAVQGLAPVELSALVDAVGLEDAGELLALATDRQIVDLLDASLWDGPGVEEGFAHDRFVTWLEVLAEGGDATVASRLAALPEESLALAFFGQLFVLDVETLGIGMAGASSHEAELAEKALDACQYLELLDYTLVARRSTGWDTVIAALLALDQRDHARVERILEACCRATTQAVDDGGGLYEVLTAEEMLLEDARADRNDRRAAQGFVSRADAEAFVRGEGDGERRDPVMAAYLRTLETPETPSGPSAWGQRLRTMGVLPPSAPALGAAGHSALRQALASLPPPLAATRQAELAFIANALVASGRGYDPLAAAAEALHRCSVGLHRMLGADGDPQRLLRDVGCDRLFRAGAEVSDPRAPRRDP